MKSIKTIKTKLLMAILGVAFGFSVIIFAVTLLQFTAQKDTIEKRGMKEAETLSTDTKNTLDDLNRQVAHDFSSACNKYFNQSFANIRKHVESIGDKVTKLYRGRSREVPLDEYAGFVEGTLKAMAAEEFGRIAPVRSFIKYLPSYDAKNTDVLDLYVFTDSGMCMDGTYLPLGNHYADLRRENWYKQAKKKGDVYWSGVFTGKVTSRKKVICVKPFYDADGHFRGCAAGDMQVESFRKMLEEFDEKQIKSVIFFDKKGGLMHATNDYGNTGNVIKYLDKQEIVEAGDEIYAFSKLKETGWTICLVLDRKEMNRTTGKLQTSIEENAKGITEIVQESIRKSIILFVVIVAAGAVLVLIITNVLAAGFVKPIRRLINQVEIVGTGNLEQEIEIESSDEIGQLARAFNRMTGKLKDYMENLQEVTADKERMTAELDVAKQIQRNMLPDTFPAFPERNEFDIYAVLRPVSTGGGNFYDFFMVDKSHLCMVIGDVSGSGVPTSMFAVVTKTHIKNYAQLGYQPDRILAETNNQLSYKNDAGLTVSVFVGIIDLVTGTMQYVNAGQMPPLWKHSGADFKFLQAKSCFALANMENVPYWQQSVRLAQGDMVVMYTRGIAETSDEKGNEYTQEYLYEYLNEVVKREYKLERLLVNMEEDLKHFSRGALQKQDGTMMAFRYFGRT